MQKQQNGELPHKLPKGRAQLWKEAIKWPLYSVAVVPVLLAAGWQVSEGNTIRFNQLFGFLIASILLLLWENLTNDLFDADTGIDEINKPHSIVALLGKSQPVKQLAYFVFFLGLLIILILALASSVKVLFLVLGSCILGYIYQGPPFRLGYKGLGEPLCWIAFGPLATAAALLALEPQENTIAQIPWSLATTISAGPALATSIVLFCSHFHQVAEDEAHGKKSPLVRLGTYRAASLVPWLIALTLSLELIPVINGSLPPSILLGVLAIPSGISLINLLRRHHNKPELIYKSKFLALRFQAINGLGMSLGLALAPTLGLK